MRTPISNIFFSLAFVFCSQTASAFKGQDRVGIEVPNPPAFQNMESRLDGSTLFRNVAIYPLCAENKIKLVDQGVEISFYADNRICMSLVSDDRLDQCGIIVGDVEVKKVSHSFVVRHEVIKLENLKDDCSSNPRPGKAH